jgi:hypothetical protein
VCVSCVSGLQFIIAKIRLLSSVGDPDPDLQDPHVFGPPASGSRSISQRYGSGFLSFFS